MSLEQLHNIRQYELHRALPLIRTGSSVLEIGAGTGWQARYLTQRGYSVVAIDIPGGPYTQDRLWPVLEYDGINLPFSDKQFDVVFSSNVLEHLANVEQFQAEVKRVLKQDGTAIHILPTGSWRFWTNVVFWTHIAKILVGIVCPPLRSRDLAKTIERVEERTLRQNLKVKALFPSRHGAIGNMASEIYLFSRFRWVKLFHRTGWIVDAYYRTRLFYTGYWILDSNLSLRVRHYASYLLGSSSHIFCLRKAD